MSNYVSTGCRRAAENGSIGVESHDCEYCGCDAETMQCTQCRKITSTNRWYGDPEEPGSFYVFCDDCWDLRSDDGEFAGPDSDIYGREFPEDFEEDMDALVDGDDTSC